MRTFDLSPLYRSTVGFDRLFSMLDGFEAAPGYPPYNIERTGENDYRVTVAVAGFGENDLSIEAKENTLTIKGGKQAKEEQNGEVLYQGIAARAFRARLPAGRPCPGQEREPRERIAARRSRARNPRGQEAAPDPDRQWQCQSPGDRHQGRGLTVRVICKTAAPRQKPGRFRLGHSVFSASFWATARNGIARISRPWSCSCLVQTHPRKKAKGFSQSGVDQSCMAGQNLAWSIRTVILS